MKELTTKTNKPIAIALGYFDCVHFAHRRIIACAVETAREKGIASAVLTFSNELSSKGSPPVYAFKERKRLISQLGADYVIPFHFDEQFKIQSAAKFLEKLFNTYDIRFIACGSDYRFGHMGEGNAEFLKGFAAGKSVEVRVFEPITMGGEVVSTSLIKKELTAGNIKKVNRLLCSPYFFEGKVTKGKGRGQGMGYPTANLRPCDRLLPKFGVYKSRTILDGEIFNSLTSVGDKPTFDDHSVTVETFVDGDVFNLYNKTIHVELIDFLRPLNKFASVSKLKAQIKKDLEKL
ncbi:MAG: riboflavin biosynthesis protein RibF [Firmicutes bacterium]|nr:riboflavin biosynthesis protein RibF [Bacillota bacterium]